MSHIIQFNSESYPTLLSFADFIKRMLMKLEKELEATIFTEIGFQVELIGILAVHFGRFLKLIGVVSAGKQIYDIGIGTVALGETIRKWFDPNVQTVNSSERFPASADEWNVAGVYLMLNRVNIDAYYRNHLN